MDYIERRIVEINKLNEEALKEENKDEDNKNITKANINLLERVQSNIFTDDNLKTSLTDPKRFNSGNINLKDIRENALELINTYIKKFDKAN